MNLRSLIALFLFVVLAAVLISVVSTVNAGDSTLKVRETSTLPAEVTSTPPPGYHPPKDDCQDPGGCWHPETPVAPTATPQGGDKPQSDAIRVCVVATTPMRIREFARVDAEIVGYVHPNETVWLVNWNTLNGPPTTANIAMVGSVQIRTDKGIDNLTGWVVAYWDGRIFEAGPCKGSPATPAP